MSFSGKATYSGGTTLPEAVDDLSDLVGIVSPGASPLLSILGDAARPARSTLHEWLEDAYLPNSDVISDGSITSPTADTVIDVTNPGRFRVGDLIKVDGSLEIIQVTGISGSTLTIVRGFGGSTAEGLVTGTTFKIIGNGSLEGDDAPAPRFANRSRKSNYTQIFTEEVEISGTNEAINHIAINDEFEYQTSLRLAESLRNLEYAVLYGRKPAATPVGSATVRRYMDGIVSFITTNIKTIGTTSGYTAGVLSEAHINQAMQETFDVSGYVPDILVLPSYQVRKFSSSFSSLRVFPTTPTTAGQAVRVYESDFGPVRIIPHRALPTSHALGLCSRLIEVKPLAGRSFYRKPVAETGDAKRGMIIGEYTVELRNETAHFMMKALS